MPPRRKKSIKNYELKITNDNREANQDKTKNSLIDGHRKKNKKLKVKNLIEPTDENFEPINQPPTVEIKFNDDKTERKNRLIMWVGISCVMAAIFVIWIFNLKHEFSASADKSSPGKFDWVQIRSELDKTMKQVKQSIAEIKQIKNNATSTSPQEPELTVEQINLLKEKLLNEAASTTTASSTVK